MNKEKKICAWCWYARMRKDICGIYCTGGFTNSDGTCDHFLDSRDRRKVHMAKSDGRRKPDGGGSHEPV